jgi:hypothetical protein
MKFTSKKDNKEKQKIANSVKKEYLGPRWNRTKVRVQSLNAKNIVPMFKELESHKEKTQETKRKTSVYYI